MKILSRNTHCIGGQYCLKHAGLKESMELQIYTASTLFKPVYYLWRFYKDRR